MVTTKKVANPLYFLVILSLIMFIIFMISSSVKSYGFFIDEVYFIACAKRPAWGYIDQPPLSIILLSMVKLLFGNNVFAIRFLPALSIAATVFMNGLTARRLGGGLISILIAGLAVMLMPVFLVFGSYYSMNAFEPLIWVTIVYFTIKMVQENKPKYWLHIGILLGTGLEMKHTIVLYGVALLFGLFITNKRSLLWNRWIIWGGLSCFIIILPNLIWQFVNHFPSLELYHNSFLNKNIDKTPFQVLKEQIIFVNPFTFPLWVTGLVVLAFPKSKPYRFMLGVYLFLLIVMIAGHSSRPDRITAIYPFLMASGAVAIEQYLKSFWQHVVQTSVAVLMLTGGIALAPVFCPLMPPQTLRPYISRLGLHFDLEEDKKGEPIPQWLADRIGWYDLAAEVAKVYHSLSIKERQNAVIISTNYGEAGALELYATEFELPPVYATHNSFHTWGPPSDTVHIFIGVFIEVDDARQRFESVEEAAVYHCPDCTKPQHNIPIYILRGPKFSIEKEWSKFKIYS